jgi:hypothetical protein
MAYVYFANKSHATLLAWHNDMVATLLAAGWTTYDTQATFTCMRSDGDAADGIYMYVKISNNAGSVSYGMNYTIGAAGNINGVAGSGGVLVGGINTSYMYADKNGFMAFSVSGVTFTPGMFQGIIKVTPKAGSFKTTTTAIVTPVLNTAVNIPVADTTNFAVGMYYHYVDYVNGKHSGFRLISKSVPSGAGNLSAILNTAAAAMASGSWIGMNPYPVIVFDQSYGPTSFQHFYPIFAGSGVVSCYVNISRYFLEPVQPYNNQSLCLFYDVLENPSGDSRLFDIELVETAPTTLAAQAYLGSSSTFKIGVPLLSTSILGLAASINNTDAKGFGLQVSATSTGPNTNTTLQDTAKTWTANQWAGKVLITTSGAAAGQITKIISNTATVLTVNAMQFTPDATGTYVICDEGYRVFNKSYGIAHYFKEGV